MSALAPASRTERSRRRGLKGLASILAFLCLVLFLLAIEQKHAVAAWEAVRYDATPAALRAGSWAADGAAGGLHGLRTAVASPDMPFAAAGDDIILAGEFGPADEATRQAVGGAVFTGASIHLENGTILRTRPLRIAAGREAYVFGRTFADRWNAPPDAQVELRTVVPRDGERTVGASSVCSGRPPGAAALLHRRDRVDLILFRDRAVIGPDTPESALCGEWSFVRR